MRIYLNGQPLELRDDEAFLTLSDFLRQRQGLTGTKIVCSEGDCGACTVLVGRPATDGTDRLQYEGVDSCILFMHQLDGTHIVSVEGLSRGEGPATSCELHPIQQSMIDCFGSQCGFCTPGFVGAMVAKVESLPPDTNPNEIPREDWQLALTGNLCRCTGYVQILEAAASAAEASGNRRMETLYPSADLVEPLRVAATESVHVCAGPRFGSEIPRELFLPVSLEEAVKFKSEHPDACVINGATDIGVLTNKGRILPDKILSLAKLQNQSDIEPTADAVRIGLRTTWAAVEEWAREALPEFYKIIIRFGSPQIRAAGTIVGNVANGSPIGDSIPLLYAMEAELELASIDGVRRVSVLDFYRGYKDFDLEPNELITAIQLPLPAADETLRLYKVSKRNDLDISTFTAAIRMRIADQTIQQARVAYGGVGPTVVRLPQTEAFLHGKPFKLQSFSEAGPIAREEIAPISDVRGSADYRHQLAENILQKFFHEVAEPSSV